MDKEVANQFKTFESIVFESLQEKEKSIIEYSKLKEAEKLSISKRSIFDDKDDEKTWHNWAGNISFEPEKILRPKSVEDLKGYVKDAQKNGKKIRCAAEGHSWSSLSVTTDYLVILNNLNKVDVEKRSDGWVAHVEAGAQILHIDDVLKNHQPPLTITSMVVLNDVRIGGVVAPGCHGATTEDRTIVDQVVGFQIVTADGTLREFSDEINHEEMQAARVNLGLLGIIYRVSIRVVPMYELRMIDVHPYRTDFSSAILRDYLKRSEAVQLFYWPFNSSSRATDKLWIKRWEKSTDAITLDALQTTFYRIAQDVTTKIANGLFQQLIETPEKTPIISGLAAKLRLIDRNEVWQAPDAIHYQAGISNIPCEDLEFAIKADKDFENVLTELNFVIDKIYEYQKANKFPVNLVVEMRILKSSSATLSFAYDPDPDSYHFFIEVLAIRNTQYYKEFSTELALRWMQKYKARPHWAKYWEYIPNIHEYLHDLMGEQIRKFEVVRSKYDPNKMFFDNDSLKRVFYGNS